MPDPVLAQKDAAVVLAEALALYKAQTGQALAPADPRRLFLQTVLLLLAQQRQLIDFSGKQSLLRYVSGEWIDELALLWGAERIPAAGSRTILTFHSSTPGPHTIPAGTRAKGGDLMWATDAETEILAGENTRSTNATCTAAGAAGNGVAIGQIDTLVDAVPYVDAVTNATATTGGRDEETTEEFRERLRGVPDIYSIAGPRAAYRALALAAGGDDVLDVTVLSHDDWNGHYGSAPESPGEVWIVVLPSDGSTSPSPELRARILAALSAETVRPLTDYVQVVDPGFSGHVPGTPTNYTTAFTYYIARSRAGDAAAIQAAVAAAAAAFNTWQTSQIGRDLNPDELRKRVVEAGAKRLNVVTPAFTVLAARDVARCLGSVVTYAGIEDD